MSLSRPDRSSSLALDLELDTPSLLDDSVSTLRASARILSDIAGVLTKFPFVKPLAAVVVIICEIFENVKSNDRGWDALGKQAVSLIVVIAEKQQEDSMTSASSLSAHCNQLVVKLEILRTKTIKNSSQSWMKKVLRNSIDKDLQVEFKRFLDHACVIFQIQTLMDINMRTAEVQAMVIQLNVKLSTFEAKLEEMKASAIQLGERQLLDRLSNISGVQYNPGKVCTPGTRLGILGDIEIWGSDFSPPFVASLRGKAGIGKSTVAHTIAVSFFNSECLAASYFFSRAVTMTVPLKNLIPELSRQLAFRIPSFRRALCAILESDDFPVFPQQQLSKLLIEPLRISLDGTKVRPWIIILDALDECEDDIRDCILLLTEAISEFRGKVKLLVTSRPEAAIDAVQKLRQTHILEIDIESVENESDLRIFFEHRLSPLRVQPGWPTVDPIQKLVMLAGGLFIWAAIVIEFLLESDTLSEEIELILNGTCWEDNPEKRLAQMYYIILEKAYLAGKREAHFRLFLPVLATVMVVREPQSDVVIAHLAGDGVRYEHLRRIIEGLSAAMYIPPDSPVVRATHPSFYRYLTDDCKDTRFTVDPATHSRRLGQRCLTIIRDNVHRDMCDLMEFADVPQTQIVDLHHRVSKCISQEVQYACKNWIFHVVTYPDIPIDSETTNLLSDFFQSRLLPWIEVMSLLDCLGTAHEGLGGLNIWLNKIKSLDHTLAESTADALLFLREFNHVITKNAIQVHVSALHFTPRSCTIWKNFIELPNHPTPVKCGAEMDWPSALMTLGSRSKGRSHVSFSPNGRLLAEMEGPNVSSQVTTVTVQIWDLDSFSAVYMSKFPVSSNSQKPNNFISPELVFSPDSEALLVLHWDAVQVFYFLQNYEPHIYAFPNNIVNTTAAIASDGSAFALGSSDNTIEIWRMTPRAVLFKKIGHGCPLGPISLSSSGTRLLYSLQDRSTSHGERTLKCWHTNTGVLVDIPDSRWYELSTDGMFILLLDGIRLSVHNSNTGSLLFQKHYVDEYDMSPTIRDVALSPDATHLAVVVADHMDLSWIYIIEMKSGCLKAAYPGGDMPTWSPSSTMLVFQDNERRIFLWEQSTGSDMVLTFSGHREEHGDHRHYVISPNGHLLATVRDDNIPLLVLTPHTKSDTPQLIFSIDGPGFPTRNGETALLGIPIGPSPFDEVVDSVPEARYSIVDFQIASGGRFVSTLSRSSLVTIYNANTGEEEGTFRTHLTTANRLRFTADGNFIAVLSEPTAGYSSSSSQSGGRQSEIWSTVSRRTVYHSNVHQILQFYPNGHHVVCASFHKALCLKTVDLDAASVRGSEVPLSKDIVRIRTTLAFATQPNAHRLAGIDLDHGSVHVWDTERRLCIGQLHIPRCYEGAQLTGLVLSADGRTLAATSINCILVWTLELDAGLLSPTLVNHESFSSHPPRVMQNPSFSPDSQVLSYISIHKRKHWNVVKREFLSSEHSPIDHHWDSPREWHGDRHICINAVDDLSFYRARDITGFPEVAEHSERVRCTKVSSSAGSFSQPGLEVYVPSHKLSITPILLRLNESQATVSWYWVQKDGRLVLLELPAP